MNYSIVIESPSSDHAGTFKELAETVHYGLRELGKTPSDLVQPDGEPPPKRDIILGAHNLPADYSNPDNVLYNLEQRGSPVLDRPEMLDLLRRHEVWDYSASNVAWLAERGVAAKHVPIGYMPQMTRIPDVPKDIDVLFYGSLNERRNNVLTELYRRRLKVRHVFGAYGKKRDALIARSRIVLNMHHYEAQIFEMVRCSYLFANRACVVSEESADVPPDLQGNVLFVPYAKLAETCADLVADEQVSRSLAETAFEAFRACKETDYLAKVLQ